MKNTVKPLDVINQIDLAHTQNEDVSLTQYVSVNEVKKRGNLKSYFVVQVSSVHHTITSLKFYNPKKALDTFYFLCLEMNLVTHNHNFKG